MTVRAMICVLDSSLKSSVKLSCDWSLHLEACESAMLHLLRSTAVDLPVHNLQHDWLAGRVFVIFWWMISCFYCSTAATGKRYIRPVLVYFRHTFATPSRMVAVLKRRTESRRQWLWLNSHGWTQNSRCLERLLRSML